MRKSLEDTGIILITYLGMLVSAISWNQVSLHVFISVTDDE